MTNSIHVQKQLCTNGIDTSAIAKKDMPSISLPVLPSPSPLWVDTRTQPLISFGSLPTKTPVVGYIDSVQNGIVFSSGTDGSLSSCHHMALKGYQGFYTDNTCRIVVGNRLLMPTSFISLPMLNHNVSSVSASKDLRTIRVLPLSSDPPPPFTPPPFYGGQCRVLYNVTWTTNNYILRGRPVVQTNVPGAISGIEEVLVNPGGAYRGWNIRLKVGDPALLTPPANPGFAYQSGGQWYVSLATSHDADGNLPRIISVTRVDGLPDNCGDPT